MSIADVPAVPAVGSHLILLNPAGGYFKTMTMDVSEGVEYVVELTLVHTNPDAEWGGLGSVCTEVPGSTLETCIRFAARGDEKIVVKKTVRQGQDGTEDMLPVRAFRVGEPIPMRVRIVAGGFVLALGNEDPVTILLDGTATKMTFLCSSALCQFALNKRPDQIQK